MQALFLFSSLVVAAVINSSHAFTNQQQQHQIARPSTRLFLEDWVAALVDEELMRQSHKDQYEKEWMEKNRAAVVQRMESDFSPAPNDDEVLEVDKRQRRRDEKLASSSPEKYCADRCVSTGNCDVYEDFFELSPKEVVKFCVECVLSDDEEPCDIPDGFYETLKP